MTPEQFKSIRKQLGLSQSEMARALRLATDRAVRGYELGEREISGPITLCLEYILKFGFIHDEK
jgi:DNA-binding transcriptional regulator YiaG